MILFSITQTVALIVMGGLGMNPNPSKQTGVAITVMMTLFSAAFNIGWGPLSQVDFDWPYSYDHRVLIIYMMFLS